MKQHNKLGTRKILTDKFKDTKCDNSNETILYTRIQKLSFFESYAFNNVVFEFG